MPLTPEQRRLHCRELTKPVTEALEELREETRLNAVRPALDANQLVDRASHDQLHRAVLEIYPADADGTGDGISRSLLGKVVIGDTARPDAVLQVVEACLYFQRRDFRPGEKERWWSLARRTEEARKAGLKLSDAEVAAEEEVPLAPEDLELLTSAPSPSTDPHTRDAEVADADRSSDEEWTKGDGRSDRIHFDRLPVPVCGFVGRRGELELLERLRGDSSVRVVCSVGGFGGVGKTALAAHYARAAAEQYPDGLIALDFQSYSDSAKIALEQALRTLLVEALGADRLEVAAMAGRDELVCAWRDMVDGRSMVFVWDNISESEQIEPLLVRNGASLTLVTTRDRIYVPGSALIDLDVMCPDDAVELFTRIAGADKCPDVEVVRLVVERCGFVPVLLEIKARDVAINVATPEQLAQGLAELPRADTKEGLYRRLDLSYRTLTPDQQEVYRIMGFHPARYLTVETCAAVLAIRRGTAPDISAAVKLLTELTRRGMARIKDTGTKPTSVAQWAYTAHDVLLDHADHLASVHNDGSDGDGS